MKLKTYDTFMEWEKDLEKIHQNPNDSNLINHVAKRVEASSDSIKNQIKEYLMDCTFDKNPMSILIKIANASKNHFVFINTKDDPWFYQ